MPFERRDAVGGAVSTTLVGTVTALDVTWQIVDSTGWPLGTNGPFYAVFDRGLPSEEKVLCQMLSGTTITLTDSSFRGVDGTTATAHAAPATFEHCSTGTDVDEANLTVSQTVGQVQALGDILSGAAPNRFHRTGVGADGSLFLADSTQLGGIGWGGLPAGSITNRGQFAAGLLNDVRIFANATARDAAIPTPTVGNVVFLSDHATFEVFNGATVGWTPPWGTAWGMLAAPTQLAADATVYSGYGTVPTLAQTITTVLNRRTRVTFEAPFHNSTAGFGALGRILIDGTQVNEGDFGVNAANNGHIYVAYVGTLSAASHVFTPQVAHDTSGPVGLIGTTGKVSQLTVEDAGPAGDPS